MRITPGTLIAGTLVVGFVRRNPWFGVIVLIMYYAFVFTFGLIYMVFYFPYWLFKKHNERRSKMSQEELAKIEQTPLYKKWWFWIIAVLALMALLNLVNYALATPGNLRQASIIQCPNGVFYGQHGGDNHWHAAQQNPNGQWSAIGEAFFHHPCPPAPPPPPVYVPATPVQQPTYTPTTPTTYRPELPIGLSYYDEPYDYNDEHSDDEYAEVDPIVLDAEDSTDYDEEDDEGSFIFTLITWIIIIVVAFGVIGHIANKKEEKAKKSKDSKNTDK